MGKVKDKTGQRFGRLIAIEYVGSSKWLCQCDCGNTCIVKTNNLTSGHTLSCGCLKFDVEDLVGQRFGNLVVTRKAPNHRQPGGKSVVMWECMCDCGNSIITTGGSLKSGHTKSCGCLHREITSKINYKHGLYEDRLYNIWTSIKQRCYNSKSQTYHYYGARKIIMCEEWLTDFTNFYNWAIASGYKDDLSIDRIDVNGIYEPSSCRWADRYTQMSNTRKTIYLTYDGKTHSLYEWARIKNVNPKSLYTRIRLGWSDNDVLGIPIKKRGNNDK